MSKPWKLFDRVEVSSIFSRHLTTFYHYEKKQFYNESKVPSSDKLLFFVLPLILAVLLCLMGLKFDKDYLNITLTCLSIFTGLLFTLLAIVLSLIQENQKIVIDAIKAEDKKKATARIELTNHLFINIGFSIVLAVLSLVFVLLTQFNPPNITALIRDWKYYGELKMVYTYLSNGVSFFLIIEFLLTLLMIVKRFTVLFINQTT